MMRFNETLKWLAILDDETIIKEENSKFSELDNKNIKLFRLYSTKNGKEYDFEIGMSRKLIFARRNMISQNSKEMIVICGWYEGDFMRVMFIFKDGSYEIKEEWEEGTIYSKVI